MFGPGGFFNSIMAKKGCKKCTETTNADANGEITASGSLFYKVSFDKKGNNHLK